MDNLFAVSGKIAIVTGGSRGIGAMIAEGLVRSGCRVYITARKVEELNHTQNRLAQLGDCKAIASDLSSLDGIQQFVEDFQQYEQSLHILVNNAGATWGQDIDTFPEAGWDKVMDLNVKSPFFILQSLLGCLQQTGTHDDPARVINISSMNGITNPGMPNYSYSASKAALIHLTKHLAVDLVSRNINVNSIAPGLFRSKMTAFAIDKNEQAIAQTVPRGRLGSAEDIAGTTIYLASRASAWMTGETLTLDGGQVACAK